MLHNGLNGGVKVKSGAEWRQVWHSSRCLFDELFPIAYCQQSIPETEKNVVEEYLGRILSGLTHHLLQDDSTVEKLIDSAAKIRQRRA